MRFGLPLLVLALTACSSQDESAPVDSEVAPDDTADSEVLGEGERSLADPTADGPTRAARTVPGIPASFNGVWDYVDGSCDPASDLRIQVFPDRIEFYESLGVVESVEVENPNTIVVILNMEGEGEVWTQETRFTLSNEGKVLTPVAADGEQVGRPMPRKKCEG